MKDRIEKLFVSIVRILFFVVAVGAFIVLIASGIYLSKLAYDSFQKSTPKDYYQQKDPQVNFDKFETLADQMLQKTKTRKEDIRNYVLSVIQNGSEGHGYPIKTMPGKLIGSQMAEDVSLYIANNFQSKKPDAFRACVACHGEDGQGAHGQSPDLRVLPIYNHLRSRINNSKPTHNSYAHYSKKQRNEFDQYIDRVLLLLNKYASKTSQPGAKRKVVVGYVQNETNKYNSNRQKLFKEQLEEGLKGLDKFSKHYQQFVSKSSVIIEPIPWQQYLKWYAEYFAKQVSREEAKEAEVQRRNEHREELAHEKAVRAREKLAFTLSVAGGALVVFILSTMLLILIRIERNTRLNLP